MDGGERELTEAEPPTEVQPSDEGPRDQPPSQLSEEAAARLKDAAFDRSRRAEDYAWRPHVYEGMFRHLPVAEGELWAWGVAPATVRSIPAMAERFSKVVPDSYVAVDLNAEGYSVAQVSCPCGEIHEVEIGTIIATGCQRAFYWFGQEVRCAPPDEESSSPD